MHKSPNLERWAKKKGGKEISNDISSIEINKNYVCYKIHREN